MSNSASRIGIGVITWNRFPYLQTCVQQIRKLTTPPFDLVIADDGSSDETLAWASAEGIPIITGERRGVAWNKNRALFYLAKFTECDIMILLEDSMWPVESEWAETWGEAAEKWHHVNFAHPEYSDQPTLTAVGDGTPDDPFKAILFGGQCTATTRDALAKVGYLDVHQGLGFGHSDWTFRFRNQYRDEWGFPDGRVPCMNRFLSEAWTPLTSFSESRLNDDEDVFGESEFSPEGTDFTPAWSNQEERAELITEVVGAQRTHHALALLQDQQHSTSHRSILEMTSTWAEQLNLFTEQLIAFRHYADGVFHLRPLVPVCSAYLRIGETRIPLTPTYGQGFVNLAGHGLIENISTVSDAEVKLMTAVGERTFGDLVTRDLVRVDAFHRASGEFIEFVSTGKFDVLEIGSRRRLATRSLFEVREVARSYVGIDIVEGPNVDIVCDAHQLTDYVGASKFDVIYSQYVFEHLAMPWVAVAEINKALRLNGECFIITNQSIGLHDLPWDFWRFSESAWRALFNHDTGFELIKFGLGEPVHITPRRYHDGFRDHEGGVGFQASFAWARKVRDVYPTWPVDPSTVFSELSRSYPKEITD